MKLIQTQEYLLLIDEGAEIKEEDYYHWKLTNTVQINRLFEEDRRLGRKGLRGHVSKVIAYHPLTKEAEELDLPLLPPFEGVDIEKLACKKYNIKEGINDYDERYYNSHNVAHSRSIHRRLQSSTN